MPGGCEAFAVQSTRDWMRQNSTLSRSSCVSERRAMSRRVALTSTRRVQWFGGEEPRIIAAVEWIDSVRSHHLVVAFVRDDALQFKMELRTEGNFTSRQMMKNVHGNE
jgi:hypothetical protein